MARSYTEITLTNDGGVADKDNTEFSFSFDYINTGDIYVIATLNPAHATPTWTAVLPTSDSGAAYDANGVDATLKKIQLAATPAASSSAGVGAVLRIYRATTQDPLVDFQGGSRISEADLDAAYRQGLFAAQEATENASTTGIQGAAAILTTGSVLLDHMSDNSVDSDQYVDGSIDTIHIANDAVGEAQLATTLDLSGHTVTLPALDLADAAKVTGALPEAKGGTGTTVKPPGTILECVSGPCDGTARTAWDGGTVHTLPASTTQDLTAAFADIHSSIFSYRPPTGTAQICYELNFTLSQATDTAKNYGMFKLWLGASAAADGGAYVEVTNAKFGVGSDGYYGSRVNFKWTFPVGQTGVYGSSSGDDAATGAVGTWGAFRLIKLTGRMWNNSTDTRPMKMNRNYLWGNGDSTTDASTESDLPSLPTITVTAIK